MKLFELMEQASPSSLVGTEFLVNDFHEEDGYDDPVGIELNKTVCTIKDYNPDDRDCPFEVSTPEGETFFLHINDDIELPSPTKGDEH